MLLHRQAAETFTVGATLHIGLNQAADFFTAVCIAGEVGGHAGDQRAVAPQPAVAGEHRGGDAGQRGGRGADHRIGGSLRLRFPAADCTHIGGFAFINDGGGFVFTEQLRPEAARWCGGSRVVMQAAFEFRACGLMQLGANGFVSGNDLRHLRCDVSRQQRVGHAPEVDAEVFRFLAVFNGEIGSDKSEQFMHDQAFGTEGHQVFHRQAGEVGEFTRFAQRGAHVFGPVDCRQRQQIGGDL